MSLAAEPATRRERRRLQIREQIVEAALSLFETQGYDATTVTEIVHRADLAYGTFFNHFPSKIDLLHEVADRALQDLFANVEEVRKQPGTFAEHLVALFESSAANAEAKGAPMRELIGAMMSLAFPQTAGTDVRRIRQAFRRVLEDGLDSGGIGDRADLDTLCEIVVGTWHAIFLGWVHVDGYPLRERASQAARFLARALAATRES